MSRSNPNTGSSNPSTRWHEWAGDKGGVRYFDKAALANVDVPYPFTFVLLDETATIKGWHDASDSGIYSNEVRDTRQEVFVVKAFKGGEIANGVYAGIRDRVGNLGGHFVANLYIAYRDGADLRIGSIQFKGAALKEWMEFRKANRKALYEKGIAITGATQGKKGSITYYTPKFGLVAVSDETNAKAVELDKELQEYLRSYFSRTKDAAAQASAEQLKQNDDILSDDVAKQEVSRQESKEPEFIDDDLPVF